MPEEKQDELELDSLTISADLKSLNITQLNAMIQLIEGEIQTRIGIDRPRRKRRSKRR